MFKRPDFLHKACFFSVTQASVTASIRVLGLSELEASSGPRRQDEAAMTFRTGLAGDTNAGAHRSLGKPLQPDTAENTALRVQSPPLSPFAGFSISPQTGFRWSLIYTNRFNHMQRPTGRRGSPVPVPSRVHPCCPLRVGGG